MKENNKSFVTIIVVLAVLVVGYVLLISYGNKKVREVVDASIVDFQKRIQSNGNEVTITYDDVKVHGLSPRPRASVYGVHVKIEDKSRRREMHLAMPEVVYIPKNFTMSTYEIKVLDSVTSTTTARGQTESVLIDFSRAPSLTVEENKDNSRQYNAYVPMNITLTDAHDAGEVAAEKTDIIFDDEPEVSWSEDAMGDALDQKAVFPHTSIAQNGVAIAELDGFSAITNHSKSEGNRVSYDTLVKLDNLVFADPQLAVLNPVSLVNDVSYDFVKADSNGMSPSANQETNITVKNIAWMSGLVSMFANGELHITPTERMPSGNLMVRFDDIDKFLDYANEQHPNAQAYLLKVRGALEKLSGATIEEGGNVTINLVREPKGGRLQIGELTLEEAFGLFIELAMQMPDFSTPKQTPAIEGEEDMVGEEEDMDDTDSLATEEEMIDEDAAQTMQEEEAPVVESVDEVDASDEDVMESPTKPANDVEIEIRTNTDDVKVEVLDDSGTTTEESVQIGDEEDITADEADEMETQDDEPADTEVPVQ